MDKAVILARGLGTRMRKDDQSAQLTQEQSQAAQSGIKAMIPIGRPFLDYVISNLADAGYRSVCLVVGPEHGVVREYYSAPGRVNRVSVHFAIQEKPLGTADAVAAAENFAKDDPFLVINSDNYYPIEAFKGLREISGSGLAGFDRKGMLEGSNIPAERLEKFAAIKIGPDNLMQRILEKPDSQTLASLPEPICLSMNCWRFGPTIFDACRQIKPSPRGELEITDAVQLSIDHLGEKFRVVTMSLPVLDLSSRGDIAAVAQKLKDVDVRL